MTFSRVDLSKYCVMSIWFGCNNACSICMLSNVKQGLPALGFEGFRASCAEVARRRLFQSLILSGAEVTTFEDLEKYVRFAASLGWFRRIQIQTNGRRLCDKDYVRRLVGCGVNEFFVSFQGLGATHDATTRVPGSFGETLQGLRNLAELPVNVITNTVLTRVTLPQAVELVTFLGSEAVSEIQLWNFFPMEGRDGHDRVVALAELAAVLPELSAAAARSGKPLVLKSFPHCLPAAPPICFDSLFPATVLPDAFWAQFGECGFGRCFHRERNRCDFRECWGLSSAYLEKYGDERDLLKPLRAAGPP